MAVTQRNAYHLCGSPTSDFFHDLSMIYAKDAETPDGWNAKFIRVKPDKTWSIGPNPENLVEVGTFSKLLPMLEEDALIVPHLFCVEGMTTYRTFFENILRFKIVGSTGDAMRLASNKDQTRSVVSSKGIDIPLGYLIKPHEAYEDFCGHANFNFPVIIKPNSEDNSAGLTLAHNKEEFVEGLRKARDLDEFILAEEFIPGRELRVAVIENNNDLILAPVIEYLVSPENPIRLASDKLETNDDGIPTAQALSSPVKMCCPANLDEELLKRVKKNAFGAHRAINARHFSLFDFRVNEKTGTPIFLEAGLFWSFSSQSMITRMLVSGGIDTSPIFSQIWDAAQRG